MNERLRAYSQEGALLKIEDRKELLKEMRAEAISTGDAPFAVPCVNLMLVNPKGELYIVQRADKPENPFLFDKTVGGHVSSGESFDETIIREAKEELGIQLELFSPLSYPYHLQEVNLKEKAIAKLVNFELWYPSLRQVKEGKPWIKRVQLAAYIGHYDGEVRFEDGEALSLQLLPKEALWKDLEQHPEKYTADLQWWVKNYHTYFWS
jgi:8-oxo-dGTP pyrophosphatase MutT (NUDIX family)